MSESEGVSELKSQNRNSVKDSDHVSQCIRFLTNYGL